MSVESEKATDKRIGANIKKARIMFGYTQEELAKDAGITFQQVQKYESGVNRIAASRLQTFAKILNQPIMFFYSDEDVITEHEGGKGNLSLVRNFCKIASQRRRALVAELVRDLAE